MSTPQAGEYATTTMVTSGAPDTQPHDASGYYYSAGQMAGTPQPSGMVVTQPCAGPPPCAAPQQYTATTTIYQEQDTSRQQELEALVASLQQEQRRLDAEVRQLQAAAHPPNAMQPLTPELKQFRLQQQMGLQQHLSFRSLQITVAEQAQDLRRLSQEMSTMQSALAELRREVRGIASSGGANDSFRSRAALSGQAYPDYWGAVADDIVGHNLPNGRKAPPALTSRESASRSMIEDYPDRMESRAAYPRTTTFEDSSPPGYPRSSRAAMSSIAPVPRLDEDRSRRDALCPAPAIAAGPLGTLSVRVLAARNLPVAGTRGPADVFAAVRVGPSTQRTDTVKDTADPIWNSRPMRFAIDMEVEDQRGLSVEVWNAAPWKQYFLGRLFIAVPPLVSGQVVHLCEPLDDATQGELELEAWFSPSESNKAPSQRDAGLRELEAARSRRSGVGRYGVRQILMSDSD
mmetsp:Transcript_25734/g.60059  ORF Transcript_25734/g.60059 Transcript_25734/m.60059 type:complete len:460 (+) Transcript_25734:71-1450(+)